MRISKSLPAAMFVIGLANAIGGQLLGAPASWQIGSGLVALIGAVWFIWRQGLPFSHPRES